MCALSTIQIQDSCWCQRERRPLSLCFPLIFPHSLRDTKHTHIQTHTMPVKTAGGPSVPHTEAVRSWTGKNVNRPSGAQFIKCGPAEENIQFCIFSTSCLFLLHINKEYSNSSHPPYVSRCRNSIIPANKKAVKLKRLKHARGILILVFSLNKPRKPWDL